MKIKSYKTLHELDDSLVDDAQNCPTEMIDPIMSCRKTIYEALERKLSAHQEERLCDYIRDKLINWCYDNKIMY